MRFLIFIIAAFVGLECAAQTWRSIPKQGNYEVTPFKQFSIDPYRNSIWMIAEDRVSVIEDDGDMVEFVNNELGFLWVGSNLSFVFTPDHIYYAKNQYGLFSFDNYNSILKYSFSDNFNQISGNEDSVYIVILSQGVKIFTESSLTSTFHAMSSICAKSIYRYVDLGSNSSPGYYSSSSGTSFVDIENDPEFLGGIYNEKKFTRLTDTIYFACKTGISKAFNYDFFDTITPFNTTNMPSANVLEMEFDENDTLWAVFGDASDNPFAIAKLDGTNWTDEINGSNSPIDFTTFHGFEIDTLGNLWFVDNYALHTIENLNSPGWLSTKEIQNERILVYPNPAQQEIQIDAGHNTFESCEILDFSGKVILSIEQNLDKSIDVSDLSQGIYSIKLSNSNGDHVVKFIKE